jgi:hypothetical protein
MSPDRRGESQESLKASFPHLKKGTLFKERNGLYKILTPRI